jgi:hypothetical protein
VRVTGSTFRVGRICTLEPGLVARVFALACPAKLNRLGVFAFSGVVVSRTSHKRGGARLTGGQLWGRPMSDRQLLRAAAG